MFFTKEISKECQTFAIEKNWRSQKFEEMH